MDKEVRIKRALWGGEIRQLREKSKRYNGQEELIAFYGSSSFRMWENMEKDLEPLQAINLGFGGSSYHWCNFFFEEVFEFLEPSRLVLYAGDNDLGFEVPEEEILGSITSLLKKVANKYGEIPVSIISVKPSPERYYLKDKIESLNKSLAKLVDSLGYGTYIDIHSQMLHPDGALRPELYLEDQLHINAQGYEIWSQFIFNHLQQLKV